MLEFLRESLEVLVLGEHVFLELLVAIVVVLLVHLGAVLLGGVEALCSLLDVVQKHVLLRLGEAGLNHEGHVAGGNQVDLREVCILCAVERVRHSLQELEQLARVLVRVLPLEQPLHEGVGVDVPLHKLTQFLHLLLVGDQLVFRLFCLQDVFDGLEFRFEVDVDDLVQGLEGLPVFSSQVFASQHARLQLNPMFDFNRVRFLLVFQQSQQLGLLRLQFVVGTVAVQQGLLYFLFVIYFAVEEFEHFLGFLAL
eukprot:CAMPEP_0116946730 /NCGR_PEP_ID=MMETSP0467-20121206/37185_1 /TAXON_ID=283647 /ORGANISM="Mesodinium pulex, Strain SPMC105" /LENGTH=252 /DNA_ID=CAMNT_0004630615 /DNA_START=415 /DNA_END=1173 /DNA_ORIENTATION=+